LLLLTITTAAIQHVLAQETADAGLKWCTLTVDSECAEVLCLDAALFAEVVHPKDLNYSMDAVRNILVKLPRNRTLADIKFLTRYALRDAGSFVHFKRCSV
jgi:hypothetical protein